MTSGGSDAGDLAIGSDIAGVSEDMSAATDLSSTDLSTTSDDMTSSTDLSSVDMVYKALVWTQQTTTLTGSFLSCSSSGTDVWITGMPAVVGISIDSGTNWNPITMPDTSASPFSVRAVSSAEVYIAGVLLGGMSYAKVYKSTNKTTFTAVYTSQSNELTAIHGGSKLFAVGKAGLVIRSTNAGVTWPAQNTPSGSNDVSNVYVAPDGTPFVTVGQYVYKSLDGGTTWLGKKALPDGATISDISGVDELNLWIVGNAGTTPYVYKTNDSGGTWDPVTVASGPTNLAGVFARSKDDVLIVGGAGAILHFFNGSMKTETSNVSTDLNAVCGLGDSKYIVVGKSATILRGE